MQTITDKWVEFEAAVLSEIDPLSEEWVERRRMFFAGAAAMLSLVSDSMNAHHAFLSILVTEIEAFQKAMDDGEA